MKSDLSPPLVVQTHKVVSVVRLLPALNAVLNSELLNAPFVHHQVVLYGRKELEGFGGHGPVGEPGRSSRGQGGPGAGTRTCGSPLQPTEQQATVRLQ